MEATVFREGSRNLGRSNPEKGLEEKRILDVLHKHPHISARVEVESKF